MDGPCPAARGNLQRTTHRGVTLVSCTFRIISGTKTARDGPVVSDAGPGSAPCRPHLLQAVPAVRFSWLFPLFCTALLPVGRWTSIGMDTLTCPVTVVLGWDGCFTLPEELSYRAVSNHESFKFNSVPTYIVTTQIRAVIPQGHRNHRFLKIHSN